MHEPAAHPLRDDGQSIGAGTGPVRHIAKAAGNSIKCLMTRRGALR